MSGAGPEVLERLRRFLADWGRPYALIGGLAIVARVRVRTTDDADVMLVVHPGDEDLLLMKLDASRGQDLDDAIAIKDAFGDRLDRAYLDRQALVLDIEERLRALLD